MSTQFCPECERHAGDAFLLRDRCAALEAEATKLRVIEKLARDFTADYAGDPDEPEYQEECARRFYALKAALDAKPEGEG